MRTLLSGLLLWLGIYFSAYSSRLALLRSTGYTAAFRFLDALTGFGPYLAAMALLVLGFFAIRPSKLLKLLSALFAAALPVTVHVCMYWVTYTSPSNTRWVMLRLSIPELIILALGLTLLAAGLLIGIRSVAGPESL
jgi:amino acid permease